MAEPARRDQHFTTNLEEVIAEEWEYIRARRKHHAAVPKLKPDNVVGLCLSGGGIRSATFGLGVLQALAEHDVLERVDYLSTVSGGGYIGSCLTSLLSNDPTTGVSRADSPFNGLNGADPPDLTVDDARLGVRHQIHHLRTHGEYIAPRRTSIFSRDLQRAVGTVCSGIVHHFALFALALACLGAVIIGVTKFLDPAGFLLREKSSLLSSGTGTGLDYVVSVLSSWWTERMRPGLVMTFAFSDWGRSGWGALFGSSLVGAAWKLAWARWAAVRTRDDDPARERPNTNVRAGATLSEDRERRVTRNMNATSVLAALTCVVVLRLVFERQAGFVFFAPLAFAVGGQLAAFAYIHPVQSWARSNLAQRSAFHTLEGASIYGTLIASIAPFLLVACFTIGGLPWLKLPGAVVSLVVARRLLRPAATQSERDRPTWVSRLRMPLLSAGVVFGCALALSGTIDALLSIPGYRAHPIGSAALTLAGAALGLAALGFLVDSNRISPHYFYRDRLCEAYLRTTARVKRFAHDDLQGQPLVHVRNDEGLVLHELGAQNGKGPYHIIVTAMNLRGSDELTRKTMLSEHFEFTRSYVGSRVTGWVRTHVYREGETKLARAMTISAAAAGSGAGYRTTAFSAFVMTLFNVRLGYWMENPWLYRHTERPGLAPTFWPHYLLRELLGAHDARAERVNLSDGGHTGDNLGLMPLLQRRCALIVVSDAEADDDYTFGSFNNAVRMAFIELNIRVEIDLSPIYPTLDEAGLRTCESGWAVGKVHYDDGRPPGRLVYIKASLPTADWKLPVDVLNYAKTHAEFPHQSTADQFFDDAQFESYRRLGHHVASGCALGDGSPLAAPRKQSRKRAAARRER